MKHFQESPNYHVLRYFKRALLVGLAFIILDGCKKETNNPSQSNNSNLHKFELKWISTSNELIIDHTYPVQIGTYMSLEHKKDTVHQSLTTITYYFEEGIPLKSHHSMSGYYTNSNQDSVEAQIWIDGVLKVKVKDQYYVDLDYNY